MMTALARDSYIRRDGESEGYRVMRFNDLKFKYEERRCRDQVEVLRERLRCGFRW